MNDVKDILAQVNTRRGFLRASAAGLAVPALMTACGTEEVKPAQAAAQVPPKAAAAAAAASPPSWQEMDRMHEAGIKAFPASTEGKGNQIMEPRMDNGVKVFELTASNVSWEIEPGKRVDAMAYNGVVPGPQIRVREGERVRVVLKNELKESTAIHFHGLETPIEQDGVPFITQPPITPGMTYAYEFIVPNAGTHMYHSHYNSVRQVPMGLLGAFIVEPKRKRAIEKVDVDYVMVLNDGHHGFTINGKSFPATEPILCKLGQKVRIRYLNEGNMIHPMHLHGMHMTVIDKDGWAQPAPWKCDTLNVAPGERWDVIVHCDKPGTWAFHCHILGHAEGMHGMFGMVTALIVTK